jgi:hypothetical protein
MVKSKTRSRIHQVPAILKMRGFLMDPLLRVPPSFSLEKFLFFEFFFPIVIDSLRETLSIAVSITSIGLAVLEIFQF